MPPARVVEKPAFRSRDISEIERSLLVRPVGLEVPVEDVFGNDRPFAVVPWLSMVVQLLMKSLGHYWVGINI